MKLKVPIYGQRDSRWSGLQLDSSPYRVGDSGCTSVVSASALGVSPDDFVNKMNATGGYTNGGLLIWQKVISAFGGVDESKQWSATSADLEWVKDKIKQGFPVVIETRFPASPDSERDKVSHQHWLVVVSDDLICNDPWYQDEVFFSARYGDPKRWIYSAHCFNKPVGQPTEETLLVKKSDFESMRTKCDKYDSFVQAGYIAPDQIKALLATSEEAKKALETNVATLENALKGANNEIGILQEKLGSIPTPENPIPKHTELKILGLTIWILSQ